MCGCFSFARVLLSLSLVSLLLLLLPLGGLGIGLLCVPRFSLLVYGVSNLVDIGISVFLPRVSAIPSSLPFICHELFSTFLLFTRAMCGCGCGYGTVHVWMMMLS